MYWIYTSTLNAEHHTTVLNAHPKLKHIAVLVCDRIIRCLPNENPPIKKQVRAAHILVVRRHITLAWRLCRYTINKKKKKKKKKGHDGQLINDLPEGKYCNFVPYGGDVTELPPTQERQLQFKKVRERQSQFLKRTTFSVVNGELGLDYPVEIYNPLSPSASRVSSLTLRQVLCAMKSCTDKTIPLFKGISIKWVEDIVAVYDISLTHEAQQYFSPPVCVPCDPVRRSDLGLVHTRAFSGALSQSVSLMLELCECAATILIVTTTKKKIFVPH